MTRVDVAFERTLLDGFGRILVSDRDLASAASVVTRLGDRVGQVPAVLVKHKVVTIAAANLERLRTSGLLSDDCALQINSLMAENLAVAIAHRELLDRQVNEVAGATASAGISWDAVTVLKGFCNARFYPAPYRRWMRDLDLFTPSWDEAHALVEELLALGYEFDRQESPWVKAERGDGREMYGQMFLVREEPDGDVARVDVHFGTYSIGYAGYFRTPLHDLRTTTRVGAGEVGVLGPEGIILLAQAHALSDGYVAVKDVNDFVSIALSDEEVDWRRVGDEIRAHALAPQASLLAAHCIELYDAPEVVRVANSLREASGGQRRTIWRTHDRSWKRRAAVNASFAFRWASRVRRQSGPRAALDAVRCYLFYVRRLRLEVRPRSLRERVLFQLMAKPNLSSWELRADACTLLIDSAVVAELATGVRAGAVGASRSVDDGIEYLEVEGESFVRLAGRTYVPTFDLLIEPERAALVPSG